MDQNYSKVELSGRPFPRKTCSLARPLETFTATQGKRTLKWRLERTRALAALAREIGHRDRGAEELSS